MSPNRPEADDRDAGHDQVAEDHPEQVEAVRGDQRVEVDAAEDVRHRDQRDRGVEVASRTASVVFETAIHL
jgi:hypothetical protein